MDDKPKVYCKLYKTIEDSPARRLYITANRAVYGDTNLSFNEYEDGSKFLCALVDGKPVGIIVYLTKKKITYLNLVYVMTKYRKKGIMRKMFKYILKEKEILEWRSATSAIPAYKSVGAKRISNSSSFRITKEDLI